MPRAPIYGFTKEDGEFKIKLLVEDGDDSWALNEAQRIKNDVPDAFAVGVVGRAFSAKHEEKKKFQAGAPLAPGFSIGHINGWPGTLGVLVQSNEEDGLCTGFVSASHVLSLNGEARGDKNDVVIYPAWPDDERMSVHRVGLLRAFNYLAYYQNDDSPYNLYDVALVQLDESIKVSGNQVPDPNRINPEDPAGSKITLQEVKPADMLWEHLGEAVYKVGRTTGFTKGILDVVNIAGQAIDIGDKTYIYNDIAAVKFDETPFSRPGDSGSVVYTADGKALGLIIGGSQEFHLHISLGNLSERCESKFIPWMNEAHLSKRDELKTLLAAKGLKEASVGLGRMNGEFVLIVSTNNGQDGGERSEIPDRFKGIDVIVRTLGSINFERGT